MLHGRGGGGGRVGGIAGKEFEEKGGERLSIKYHKCPSNPIQNEQSLKSKLEYDVTVTSLLVVASQN